jgi:predicted AlkP superfamily phosphohydrolase/phosphomutase
LLNVNPTLQKANQDNRNLLVRRIFLDLKDIDFDQTQAYAFGEYAGIYLTKNANANFTKRLIRHLKKDLSDRISFIDTSTNIYRTHTLPPAIPDIQLLFDGGATTGTSVYAFHSGTVFKPSLSGKSGTHRMNGILSILHPQALGAFKSASIYDVMPTLSRLTGISPKRQGPGRPLPPAVSTTQISV